MELLGQRSSTLVTASAKQSCSRRSCLQTARQGRMRTDGAQMVGVWHPVCVLISKLFARACMFCDGGQDH